MPATLSLHDFEASRKAEIAKLRELAGNEDKWRLQSQIRAVEGLIRTVYQCAAIMARKEETLEGTAGIWKQMVAFCDALLKNLQEVKRPPQFAGATCDDGFRKLYDLALDCRNAAAKRMELHM